MMRADSTAPTATPVTALAPSHLVTLNALSPLLLSELHDTADGVTACPACAVAADLPAEAWPDELCPYHLGGAATPRLPRRCLAVLIGPRYAGKSTYAQVRWPREVLSPDRYRQRLDVGERSATAAIMTLLHAQMQARLAAGLTTVMDATNVSAAKRRPLLAVAATHQVPAVAIVVDTPLPVCLERARRAARYPGSRQVPERVVQAQHSHMLASVPLLRREGFAAVHRVGQGWS